MKYAYINQVRIGNESGFMVSIGRDVPGNLSHGAALPVGVSPSFGEAVDVCLSRGIPTSRISFGEILPDYTVREMENWCARHGLTQTAFAPRDWAGELAGVSPEDGSVTLPFTLEGERVYASSRLVRGRVVTTLHY